MSEITLVIDRNVLDRYETYYFEQYPRRKKVPIPEPYHESINVWMILKRPMMNALKQRWKDFICWFVEDQGYSNLRIEECDMEFTVYYKANRRRDVDNSTPKFILDGFTESGFIVDDDCKHVQSLLLRCFIGQDYPRTEIKVRVHNNPVELKE